MTANEAPNARHSPDSSATLFLPRPRGMDSRGGWSLSPDLRGQITRRLRLIGFCYSGAFILADIVPSMLFGQFGEWLRTPTSWMPAVVSILAGFAVAIFAGSPRLSWQAKLNLGLAFEILGSYSIAYAQYGVIPDIRNQPTVLMVLSPSWVAIWMLFYSIIVPAPPAKTLVALIASAAASPLIMWFTIHAAHLGDLMPLPMFLTHHVLPYAVCAAMAYAGALVVYKLGTDAARAYDLGSYRLIERLGRGGMGEVWRASHQLLARPAAIKFIRPEAIAGGSAGDTALMLRRFELEARSTASLTSAHTVCLYDFGMADNGAFYYVMELLDGLDCDELVRRFGALPQARVVHLLKQMCESLDEAHSKGLIHRDVKPANIYVCRNGGRFDFVKILDFGLVTRLRAPDTDETRLTLPNQAIGTPHFMPPEVALGKEPDGRADLYAVGCVAYWLVTGRAVFAGESLFEIVSNHLHTVPEPPSGHTSEVTPELDAVILACLEKDPDRRPRSARELSRMLHKIPVAEPWGDEEAEAWWREAGLIRPESSEPV